MPINDLTRCARARASNRSTLRMARQIAHKAGLRYVYTGNIHDPAGQSTCCHCCGALLIGRDWYDVTGWHLSADGRCLACGTPCRGVFKASAGRWGARRQPLDLRTPKLQPAFGGRADITI